MRQYYLKIRSKNEKSLKSFLSFFFKHFRTKFNIIQKSLTSHNNKKIITLLKSPHVNKTAQDHYELRIFFKKIQINSCFLNKNFIFLKKVLTKLFHDVSIKIELTTNLNITNQNRLVIFYPDNLSLFSNKLHKTNFKRFEQKLISKRYKLKKSSLFSLTKFLNITSVFGEIITLSLINNKKSLNSSAVEQRTENPCAGSSNLSSDKNILIMKNYLWNMFANIKNGQLSKRSIIFQRRKKICEAFLKILWAEGFILGYKIEKTNQIKILLKYTKNKPAIHSIKFLSKPSRRLYFSAKQIWKINSNKSFIIFSTNKGLKSLIECKKLKIGGEPFIAIN